MSFASNFQPLGTSDDQSFELIGALLWCSVTTSTGRHFWVDPRGESRRSEPPKCNPNLHPLICANMFSMQPWRNNFKCSTARTMIGLFSWRLMELPVNWIYTVKTKRSAVSCFRLVVSLVVQAVSLAYLVQHFPATSALLALGSCIYPHPPLPFIFPLIKSVWQVSGSIGVAAPGWRVRVYQQWDGGVTGFAKGGSLWTLPAKTSTI